MESNTKAILTGEQEPSEAKTINIGHLISYLKQLRDDRKRRGIRYRLEVILVLVILAKLCGQNKGTVKK